MWGNGLKDPDKFLELSARQIADKTQRSVQVISFAHSAANLATHAPSTQLPSYATGYAPLRPSDHNLPPGDLNAAYPTVREQADCAAVAYPTAEIVVLNGCINEVGAEQIALPPVLNKTSKEEIEKRVLQYCSTPMLETLTRVRAAFPLATLILLNYYQIVSQDSSVSRVKGAGTPPPGLPRDGSSQRSLQKLAREQQKLETMKGNHPSVTQEATVIQSWPENSVAFLNTTQTCFRWAIAAASGSSTTAGPPCSPDPSPLPEPSPEALRQGSRIFPATVLNRPAYAYGAKQTHVWSLPVHFLFWTLHADDLYRERRRLCRSHYEGLDQALALEICTVNPVAHPNREGSKAYACSIVFDPSLHCELNEPGILDRAWAKR